MTDETNSGETSDLEKLRKQVEARIAEEKKTLPIAGANGNGKLSSKFIMDCLYSNELGDGILYAELLEGKFIFNKAMDEWYRWTGHHWQRDITDSARARVEDVSKVYLDEACRLGDRIATALAKKETDEVRSIEEKQKDIYRRVSRLRSDRGRTNTLKFAATNPENALDVKGDEFDTNPWKLACQNGVIDLKTGELEKGDPLDYISRASPTAYEGIDATAPHFERALLTMFKEDHEMVAYVRRLLGYGITGLINEHILPIFWGQGRNGKGTIVETLKFVLGELAAPIQAEMLLDQGRAKSSSGPSADLMSLRGLRIAFGSESDENRRFSTSKVKWLTGGDTLVGRYPHDKFEIYFAPTHLLIMMTNNRPHAPAEDYAFWERCHLVPFEISFVTRDPEAENERPADKELSENLREEAPGILAWLVRGCIDWQEQGLNPPQAVVEATAKYRREEDWMSEFIDACCFRDPDAETASTDLYTAFREWWQLTMSKKGIPSQSKWGKIMAKRFKKAKKGTVKYFGIGLVDNQYGQQQL